MPADYDATLAYLLAHGRVAFSYRESPEFLRLAMSTADPVNWATREASGQ